MSLHPQYLSARAFAALCAEHAEKRADKDKATEPDIHKPLPPLDGTAHSDSHRDHHNHLSHVNGNSQTRETSNSAVTRREHVANHHCQHHHHPRRVIELDEPEELDSDVETKARIRNWLRDVDAARTAHPAQRLDRTHWHSH